MKTVLLTLLVVASCNGSGGGNRTVAALDPDLENGPWVLSYANENSFYEDRVNISGRSMKVESYCISCGNTLTQTLLWRISPVDKNTAKVNTGSETLTFDYKITGNRLDVWFDDGDHNVYFR